MTAPLTLRMHPADNVAIVANEDGLPAGTRLPDGLPGAGLELTEKVPQGHKLALVDIAAGACNLESMLRSWCQSCWDRSEAKYLYW